MKKLTVLEKRNTRNGWLFILPNVIGFIIFILGPVLASFALSFTKWDGFATPEFVGISNYVKMFTRESFKISFWNTIFYTALFVPFTLAFAILVAVLLKNTTRLAKVFRTAFFLPYLSSTVAVAIVWQLLYHPTMGPINTMLMKLGVENPPRWLSSQDWAMLSVIIMSIWRSIGYYMVIYLAALQGIPSVLYEAAEIDGASPVQRFFRITLPSLSPTIFFTIIIAVIHSFKVFDQVFILTEGGPGRATNVLAYVIYNESFVNYKMGYASAMAYVLYAMIMVITIIQFRGQKKWVTY